MGKNSKLSKSPKKPQMSELVSQFPFAVIPSLNGTTKAQTSIDIEKPKPTLKKPKNTPYSILTGGSKAEWDAQKSHLESMMGSKTTRAHVMA
jgi:hypothetical protein